MSRYIKDCLEYAKKYPFKKGDKLLIWLRNVLYVNAQPRYWYGRLITKVLSKGARERITAITDRDSLTDDIRVTRPDTHQHTNQSGTYLHL